MLVTAIALIVFAAEPSGIVVNNALKQGYDDMYNLRFDKAHAVFHQFERDHPTNPMGSVSDAAAYLFAELNRLNVLRSEIFVNNQSYFKARAMKPDPATRSAFEADLNTAARQCQEMLTKTPNDPLALLADVLVTALHANYEALIAHQNMKALAEVKAAQREADKLLSICPTCYDADLAIGVENYLLSQKAAPVRWFLSMAGAETDKRTGIEKLRLVAEKGVYLGPYAKILLAIAELRDGNKQDARQLLSQLSREFPENALFRDELKKLS